MERYVETFFRNRWLVVPPALVLFTASLVLAALLPPQHEATATIWTETATYLDLPTQEERYLSPAEIEGRRFRELAQTQSFAAAVLDRITNANSVSDRAREAFAEQLHLKLQVNTTGDNTLSVTFEHSDKQTALAVVDQAIAEYTRIVTQTAAQQAQEAITFYTAQIRMYEQEILPRSTQAVADYLRQHPQARDEGADGVPLDPEFALLDEQARTDRTTYQQYQQRLSQVEAQSQAVATSQPVAFRTIDPAHVPSDSGGPNLKLLALFTVLGLGLSMGYLAVFVGLATLLDRTVRSAADVGRAAGVPVLAVVDNYALSGAARRALHKEEIAAPAATRALRGNGNI